MSQLYIDDIKISYQGCDLSQFGLCPLVAWYLLDVLKLRDYFQQVTVNKKRHHHQKRKPKKRDFTDEDRCIGLLALSILGISRISQITERLSNETQLAKLLSLPRFFSQATAHQYLNRCSQWHVSQLDSSKLQLLMRHGNCTSQPIVVVDVDSQTHTLESRKREGAVAGYNRKKRGKPCYQWNVALVCSEAVAQRLCAGNTHCRSTLLELLEESDQKLHHPFWIARLYGGYLSGEILNTLVDLELQCMSCRYDWVLSQGVSISESMWQPVAENCMLWAKNCCQQTGKIMQWKPYVAN